MSVLCRTWLFAPRIFTASWAPASAVPAKIRLPASLALTTLSLPLLMLVAPNVGFTVSTKKVMSAPGDTLPLASAAVTCKACVRV